MNEQKNKNIPEELEIDLFQLVKNLWAHRKFILKYAAIGAVVGVVVAYSLPEEYSSKAKLAPELPAGAKSMGSLSGLAAMAGFSTGSLGSGGDAISATLYPDIVNSLAFIAELFPLQIETVDGEVKTDLFTYMDEHQKSPWWSYLISAPGKAIGFALSIFKNEVEETTGADINVETPTLDQHEMYEELSKRITANVDKKTFVITINVKMQDPQVALDITKVVIGNLQKYITDYRTAKVKKDLEYIQTVYEEAKQKYFDQQERYAKFEDENRNISSSRYLTEQERLRNEMELAYSVYTSIAQNLEEKKIKVQEETPIYAIIEPASRATRRSEPNRPMVLIVFTFLASICAIGYRIYKDELIEL